MPTAPPGARLPPPAPTPASSPTPRPTTAEGATGAIVPFPGLRARRARLRTPARRRCSFTTYALFLLAGAMTGIALAVDFVGTHSAGCAGGDARGQCLMDHAYAPAFTRFALVLICAHGLASLVLEVIPEVWSRRRAGYRLRRAPKPAPVPATLPVLRRTLPREVVRAVCRRCDTIVTARAGRCQECDGPVVARRG